MTRLNSVLSTEGLATLAVSGGTTPKLMFEEFVAAKFPWDHVHLFFVDERAVPPDHEQSNFRLAREHFLIPARIPAKNVHRIQAELPPEEASARYVEDICHFFGIQPDEVPRFDVVQRGMGADAHTASLFPGEPLIDDRKTIAAAVYVKKLTQWRITLLPATLIAARNTASLVTGADKANAVYQVFFEDYDPNRLPSQLVTRQGKNSVWFLDEAAAARLPDRKRSA